MTVCTGVLQRRVGKSFQTALEVSSIPVIVLKYLPEIFFFWEVEDLGGSKGLAASTK